MNAYARALQRKRRQEAEAARQKLRELEQQSSDRTSQPELGEPAGMPLFLQSVVAGQSLWFPEVSSETEWLSSDVELTLPATEQTATEQTATEQTAIAPESTQTELISTPGAIASTSSTEELETSDRLTREQPTSLEAIDRVTTTSDETATESTETSTATEETSPPELSSSQIGLEDPIPAQSDLPQTEPAEAASITETEPQPEAIVEAEHPSSSEAAEPSESETAEDQKTLEADLALEAEVTVETEQPNLEETADLDAKELPVEEETASQEDTATSETITDAPGEPGENSTAIVRAWQSGVQRSTQAIPPPTPGASATAHTHLQTAGQQATSAQQQQQQTLGSEATGNIPPTPEVEQPPAPPASNPIPEQTQQIEAASNQRLPTQELPQLVISRPLGTMPRIGMRPVPPQLFQLIITPGAIDLARIPTDPNNRERQDLNNALRALQDPLSPELLQGTGQPAPLVDRGPQPIHPLPEGQRTPVGNVIARLLAQPQEASRDVLALLRRSAYPGGVLQREYPDIGTNLQTQLQPELERELRDIATAAGLSAAQLDSMVQTRQQELQAQAQQTQSLIQQTGELVCQDVSQSGQQTLNTIAGVRQSTDEEIVQRQEAASGGNDPQVIEARRDLVIRWVRERVTTQITNYQNAGDRRETELTQGQQQQEDAYNATAQRDEYQILNGAEPPLPETARPTNEEERQRLVQRLRQDRAAEARAWARDEITRVQGEVRRLKRAASEQTRSYRTTIETAGTNALQSARQWADDRILEGRSWWERIVARLTRWFSDARNNNERWEVRRTQQTRDGIVQDLNYITRLQTQIEQGATQEQLLQQEGLSQEQRAVIEAYFQQGGSRHPLDLAAIALRHRLASNHRSQAISAFEQELLAKPDADYDKLNAIGRAMRSGFDAARIAQDAHAAMDQWGTDEAAIYRSLQGLNTIQAAAVRKCYRFRYGADLDADLRDELSDEELDRARLQLEGRQATADAVALHDAIAGLGTDEAAIMELLRSKSPEEIEAIRAEYQSRYGESLEAALRDDLSEGNEQDQADALLRGDTATADAIALDESMRGGIVSWGTNEEEVQRTYQRVRDEVLAQAQREGWNSEQMEAEIRRRNQAIEQRFNTRYASVTEYQVPGMEGQSILRQAFSSEMSGPELNLANALADNDMIAADAARMEIERQGVYASDEAMNGVLRGQYERALQATRLDQGPARRMAVDREMNELLRQNPHMTEEEISRRRFQLEHQMERTLEDEAQRRSRISMAALQNAYDQQYGRPLWYVLETNMSGNDLSRARAMLRQGGRLTPLQEIEYATRGDGTDEDALRRTLSGMTRSEIAEVRRQWEQRHPGESFDAMLRGELSGRDEFEIMDMVQHGAPESASERIAQQRRHADHELNSTGFFGGLAARREATWLNRQMQDLGRLETQLYRTDLTPEERLRFRDELDMRVERVQGAIEDHQRAIDSVTNTATQIVGLVVGITVGAVLTVVSGGALGPVMIAVIASAASTLSTMATKRLIQGEAYGIEDMGVDLAVGVVDALTSAATAGMGGRLLRGAGEVGETAARAVRPTQATRLIERMGQSAIAQRIARMPGVQGMRSGLSRLNQLESGVLTRGITGQNPLARMARSNSRAMQLFAELLAEGIENTASALPSSLASTALSDDTWHGNAALNLLEGTFMGVGTGLLMGGAMQGAGHLYHGVRSQIRTATPAGRIREANRILGEAFQGFLRENPTASYADFMAHPEGARARAEVHQRGLLPSVEPDITVPRPDTEGTTPRPTEPSAAPRPDTEGTTPRPDAEPTAPHPTEPSAAPRPDAEPTTPRPDTETPPTRSLDTQAEALRNGLPARMRENVPVEVNPELPGRTVRVVPDVQGGLVVGVKVIAGSDARPIDILMHSPVIQGMQRYSGLLGRIRTLLERAQSWFYLESHIPIGSRAWEARLELQKLPGIIEERMSGLSRADLDPIERARILADVEHLSQQIDRHQAAITARDISEGQGFVAAEDRKVRGVPDVSQRPQRTAEAMAQHERAIAENSPLEKEHGTVYQVGNTWQEGGRVYRMVEVLDAEGRVARVREEIQEIDPNTGRRLQSWVQRGSESSRAGRIGETASDLMTQATKDAGEASRAIIPSFRLQNAQGNGFDGAYIRFDANGRATIVVIEVKNYPSRYVPLADFTAIHDNLGNNFANLRALLESPFALEPAPHGLGLTPQQHQRVMEALSPKTRRVELQIRTTPDTLVGGRETGTVLRDLERRGRQVLQSSGVTVTHQPIDSKFMDTAINTVAQADRVGQISRRVQDLGGGTTAAGSPELRQAQAMLVAEGQLTSGMVTRTGPGEFIDEGRNPFRVLTPGAQGGSPNPATLADSILTQLRQPRPSGANRSWTIIVDTSDMSAKEIRTLRQHLARAKDGSKLFPRLLIHNRHDGSLTEFEP